MVIYKHTQISYLMIVIVLLVFILFARAHVMSLAEPVSADSGTNFAVTTIMVLILLFLTSFTTLTVFIDEAFLRIKFGYGIFTKMFPLNQIISVQPVKNRWYYGWGIKVWFWPYMKIYNVSGYDAVEIIMKNGKIYRIGTDNPGELATVIKQAANI
ncbi:MAG: hypothetical protein PWQ35_582 [Patescibacteria group bacterium]|nr:hypothetical protein [Patescibacteria group bacterium]